MTGVSEARAKHAAHSVLRERIVEHVFVGEAMRRLWQLGIVNIEILRAEFDATGYDVVMCCGSVMRRSVQGVVGRWCASGSHHQSAAGAGAEWVRHLAWCRRAS